MRIKTYIGVDVSKLWLDAFIQTTDENEYRFHISNSPEGLLQWEKQLKKAKLFLNTSAAVAFEQTEIYTHSLLSFLQPRTCKVFMESPLRIKRSMGIQRGKTDVSKAIEEATKEVIKRMR